MWGWGGEGLRGARDGESGLKRGLEVVQNCIQSLKSSDDKISKSESTMSHKEINFNYPDLNYNSAKGKSGKINNETDGRLTQSIRSKEHFIETTAYPNGEIARRVDLGSFNYKDGILKDEEST